MMNQNFNKKLLSEIAKFKAINTYLKEQQNMSALGGQITPVPNDPMNVPPAPGPTPDMGVPTSMNAGGNPDMGMNPPADQMSPLNSTEMIDPINPDEKVELIDDNESEELDITDLVDSQKEVLEKQEKYFKGLFAQLDDLTTKLNAIDNIVNKVSDIENKLEKYRPRTPEEKLELRSLDSYPFKQKLSDFFIEKEPDMEKSGKEYVITSDDAVNFSPKEIENTFSAPTEVDGVIDLNKIRNMY